MGVFRYCRIALLLPCLVSLSSGPLWAAEKEGSQPSSPAQGGESPEAFEEIIERLALKPEQIAPFKTALQAHRDAQRQTMETHPMGRGKFKDRKRVMEANTEAFMTELEGILNQPQLEIFKAWWEERKGEEGG